MFLEGFILTNKRNLRPFVSEILFYVKNPGEFMIFSEKNRKNDDFEKIERSQFSTFFKSDKCFRDLIC